MIKNAGILYLYDAHMTNPNGDPDEENRPRMDSIREVNLVTDLRLKRYIRNYALDNGKKLFVQKVEDKSVTAEERIANIKTYDEMLDTFYDMRVFGATVPKKGDNRSFTGPVQFNWGYSLNKVELIEASITSHFASKSGNSQGSIGKDYRVKYSLLAFSGVVSGKRAEGTKMTEDDLVFLDEAMVNAIPSQATRSKVGQYPRMYMRVILKDDKTFLKDLRSYIDISKNEEVFKITDFDVDITKLVAYLKAKQDNIDEVKYFIDEDVNLISDGKKVELEKILGFVKMTKGCVGDDMECLIFDIEGKFAHFRKTYTNSSSMSYLAPPRTTIIGLIAGLLGRDKDSYYEEFSSENIDVGVKVETKIHSIMQTLNYIKATSPKGIFNPKEYTQIPFEVLQSDKMIRYRIYLHTQNKELFSEIENMLKKEQYIYPPCLGVAFFTGQIDYIGKIAMQGKEDSSFVKIASTVNTDYIKDIDVTSISDIVMVKELMPTNFKQGRKICKSSSYLVVSEPRDIRAKLSTPYVNVKYDDRDENILFM